LTKSYPGADGDDRKSMSEQNSHFQLEEREKERERKREREREREIKNWPRSYNFLHGLIPKDLRTSH
jgi:hypothetical protein